MIFRLFTGLTTRPRAGRALFDQAVAIAREPHWYRKGAVPDTIEGRFAMLATVVALITVRLERDGEETATATVGMTEHFIEAMDSEHRQMGVSDPKLGRQVLSLVGALGARVERWRLAVDDLDQWDDAVRRSVYRDSPPADSQVFDHVATGLRDLWNRLSDDSADSIVEGAWR